MIQNFLQTQVRKIILELSWLFWNKACKCYFLWKIVAGKTTLPSSFNIHFLRKNGWCKKCQFMCLCTVGQKKKNKNFYLFQHKLSYRNETGTNHLGLMSISVWSLKFSFGVRLHGGSLANFNFFQCKPPTFSTKS